jgi:hypothetical protein
VARGWERAGGNAKRLGVTGELVGFLLWVMKAQ